MATPGAAKNEKDKTYAGGRVESVMYKRVKYLLHLEGKTIDAFIREAFEEYHKLHRKKLAKVPN